MDQHIYLGRYRYYGLYRFISTKFGSTWLLRNTGVPNGICSEFREHIVDSQFQSRAPSPQELLVCVNVSQNLETHVMFGFNVSDTPS